MSGGVGLLLLVEAEMSRPMYEIDIGDSNAEAEAKKHNCIATKGIGKEVPLRFKDAGCISDDLKGVLMVSSGRMKIVCIGLTLRQADGSLGDNPDHKSGGYLQYNEYISYNVSHLKLRYLVKVAM